MNSPSDPTENNAGDFVQKITEIQPGLRAFIRYLLSGSSGASKITQEVNLLLWEKRDQYEVGSNFRSWVFTIARYQVISHLRQLREGGKTLFSQDLMNQLAIEWQEDQGDHEKQLVALEFCLEKLPHDDLSLVRSRFSSNGGVEHFAKGPGRSPTMRLKLFRLRATLKRCVGKQIEEEGDFA